MYRESLMMRAPAILLLCGVCSDSILLGAICCPYGCSAIAVSSVLAAVALCQANMLPDIDCDDKDKVSCFVSPCAFAKMKCPRQDLRCVENFCYGCNYYFKDAAGSIVYQC